MVNTKLQGLQFDSQSQCAIYITPSGFALIVRLSAAEFNIARLIIRSPVPAAPAYQEHAYRLRKKLNQIHWTVSSGRAGPGQRAHYRLQKLLDTTPET